MSAGADEYPAMLAAIATVLRDERAAFKLPRRVDDVVLLNSGDAGAQQLGKIVTVYPRDVDHARAVIGHLDDAWPSSRGPEVQTDLHVHPGSAVSFRYGAYGTGGTGVDSRRLCEFAVELAHGAAAPSRSAARCASSRGKPSCCCS